MGVCVCVGATVSYPVDSGEQVGIRSLDRVSVNK